MKTIDCRKPDGAKLLAEIFERTAFSEDIDASVSKILKDVRNEGDAAISRYALEFDGVDIDSTRFRVSRAEIAAAESSLSDRIKDAIKVALDNVLTFSKRRIPEDWSFEPRPGVTLGERFVPLDRIAAYVPGGTAPLVSTTLHTICMAKAVGVPEIVVVSPPTDGGNVNPAILYAADLAGATEIYRLGGVYAIGAMGYGTSTIKRVQKIVGPGNAYVTAAKRQIYGYASLDMVAGPSEILIIADDTARADFIAAEK